MKLPKVIGEYRTNYILNHLTWFKVGGPAQIFFKPLNFYDLANFLAQNQGELVVTIIGAGSNIIIRDGGIDGVVIKLGQNFTNIEFIGNNREYIIAGSGCLNYNLARFCQAHSIAGFEFLSTIPGTVGGGVAMNAGAYNCEFKDIIVVIEALDSQGKFRTISNEEIGFKYRGNNLPKDFIITKTIFKTMIGDQTIITTTMNRLHKKRLETQPIKERTGGSTFANPEYDIESEFIDYKAWQLIDKVGMRGYRIGDASISTLHCNFMINHGNASASNLEELGNYVQKRILVESNINLQWEIKRIGKYA